MHAMRAVSSEKKERNAMKQVIIPKATLRTASLFALLLVVLMSGCATFLHPQESGVTTGSGGRSAQTTSFHTTDQTFTLTIPLQRAPQGTLMLFWLKARGMLAVHIQATLLAPNSLHPVIAHRGSCTDQVVQPLYVLTPLRANGLGGGTSFSTLHIQGIPQSGGWSIDIYNGPNAPGSLSADSVQTMPLGCLNISTIEDTRGDQIAFSRPLIAPWSGEQPVPDQAVSGTATFTFSINGNPGANGSLPISLSKVVLSMRGLVSNSIHVTYLHVGSCQQQQGNILASLMSVTANAAGAGTSTTILSPPIQVTDLLYLTVHEAAAPSSLTAQQGFDLLACSNLPKL
jgi:hypothetical protein